MALHDAMGRELVVGDLVVYPISFGAHSLGMRSARIVEIREKSLRVVFTDDIPGRPGRYGKATGAFVHKVKNVVKV